jgi:hypothetical protein
LDNNKDEHFSVSQLRIVFINKMNRSSIARALTSIIKREEYEAIIHCSKTGRQTLFYGVKK